MLISRTDLACGMAGFLVVVAVSACGSGGPSESAGGGGGVANGSAAGGGDPTTDGQRTVRGGAVEPPFGRSDSSPAPVIGTASFVPVTGQHSLSAPAPLPTPDVGTLRVSIPARGTGLRVADTVSSSCSLGGGAPQYYGGALIQRPKVFGYYWSASAPFQGQLEPFYATLTTSPFIDWLKEYDAQNNASTDVYSIRRGSWIGSFVDTGAQTSGTITLSNVANRIASMAGTNGVPSPDSDTIYAIQIPSTLTVHDDRNASGDSCSTWCGIHGSNYPTPLRFTIVVSPNANCQCEDGSGNWLNEATEVASWSSPSCYHLGYPLLGGDFDGDGYTDFSTYCGSGKDWNVALNSFDRHGA
jgi:hypothetical protein